MGLFGKNTGAGQDGARHWTNVIKNSGPGGLLLWRQPEEDFNTDSTLVVMPGESAVFVSQGTIEQVFESGTYQLSTQNYPFITRLRSILTGGVSTFHCAVYFVRKADSREIRWGTATPIQVRDKVWGIYTSARARGAYRVRIEDPAVFLEKLTGGNIPFQFQEQLEDYFSREFQSKIKSAISRFLNSRQEELIGIDAFLDELSGKITPYIDETLAEYGLKCVNFSLAGLDIDTGKYDAIDQSQIDSIRREKLARGDKAAMDVLGGGWERQKAADILGDLARNSGSSGIAAGAGMSMGMGMAAGNALRAMAGQLFSAAAAGSPASPAADAAPSAVPSPEKTAPAGSADPVEALGKLKKLLDAGLIEQSEYDEKKKEILSRL